MPAGNYKIYSGHGDTGLPDGTAGTHPGSLGTWPLGSTSTTWYRQEKPLAVWTILIPATWGRLWHQLLEALDNFELLDIRASQLQVWSHEYGITVPGSSQVVIQVLHDLARSSSRVRVYLSLEIRF